MFNLMIVEDEIRLQYNLAYNIPWEDHGIEVVGTANSGEEALPLIQLRKPDILLIDIEMQGMDGLQLMKLVLEQEPAIRFIVISGHDDFEYTRTALRQRADNYLLKPAGNPEIIAAVLESVERIKVAREEKYSLDLLQQRWKEHLPSLQNGFLQQWAKGKYTDREVERSAENLMLETVKNSDRLFLIAIVKVDPQIPTEMTFTDKDTKWLQFSLHSVTLEFLNGTDCLVFIDDDGSTAILFRGGETEQEEELLYRINICVVKLLQVVKDCLKVSASAGIGNPSVRGDVPVSYRQAQSALLERALYGYNLVIPFNFGKSSMNEVYLPDLEMERRFQLSLETGDPIKAKLLVRQWYSDKCESAPSVQMLQEQFLFMHSLLIRIIHAQGWSVLEVAGEELANLRRPDEMVGKDLLVPWAEKVIDKYLAFGDNQLMSKRHHFIDGLMEIVEQTLDQDIGLHAIADRLFVHPSYLSRLFKKETGRTFSAYIMERKMQRAKELIQKGAKVYEASRKIGYRDVSYFTKLFRKYWGVMPSDVFRDR